MIDDSLDYFDDDSAETTEMDQLQDKFVEMVTKEVEEQLTKSKYELDDKRMLMLVVGSTRLESVRHIVKLSRADKLRFLTLSSGYFVLCIVS